MRPTATNTQQQSYVTAQAATTMGVATLYSLDTASTGIATKDVRSVNNGVRPFKKTEAVRASLRFEPTASLSAQLMYQYMQAKTRSFPQVTGTGAPGPGSGNPLAPFLTDLSCIPPAPCILFPMAPPAGYNGPVIDAEDRLAVGEGPARAHQRFHLFTANVDWRFAGQKLSYVGGWQQHRPDTFLPQDPFNLFTGEFYSNVGSNKKESSHEIRLASEERILGRFDYTVGLYFSDFHSKVDGVQSILLPIANPLFLPFLSPISASRIRRPKRRSRTSDGCGTHRFPTASATSCSPMPTPGRPSVEALLR